MSSVKFELIATNRAATGKSACNKLRNQQNLVPAILYGSNEQNLAISLDHDKILQISEHENFYSKILNLIIDGQPQKVVLKDLQRHPFKPKILHLDFQRVKETDVLVMQIPLHFINADKCPGTKAGGLINHHANAIEVRCQAQFLPEFIEVDLSTLELGQIIHLSNLILPQHIELLSLAQHKTDAPVVSVHLPKTATETEPGSDLASSNAEEKETKDTKETKDKGKAATPASSKSANTSAKQDKK